MLSDSPRTVAFNCSVKIELPRSIRDVHIEGHLSGTNEHPDGPHHSPFYLATLIECGHRNMNCVLGAALLAQTFAFAVHMTDALEALKAADSVLVQKSSVGRGNLGLVPSWHVYENAPRADGTILARRDRGF